MLPVEFARVSRDGRLTLVLVEGVPVQPTLWAVSKTTTLEEAAADLQAREGCGSSGIGSWPQLHGRSHVSMHDAVIQAWAESKGLEGVVWTSLGPKGPDGKLGLVSHDVRLDYLRTLIASGSEGAAREYIEEAPEQIGTPFREVVGRELGWG